MRVETWNIDVTNEEHKELKAMAALRELEKLLDRRIREAEAGHLSRRTVKEIFAEETRTRKWIS